MNTPSQKTLTRILAACCVILGCVIGVELLYPAQVPATDSERIARNSVVPGGSSLPAFAARPLADFDQVLERPLFYEDRRLPVQPTAPDAEPEKLEPLRLTLEGVAIGGGSRVAVLHDERERIQIQLAEGMTHNGWVLESVKSAGAEFRRGTDVTRLELENTEGTRRRRR
jgi:hypothetical protein